METKEAKAREKVRALKRFYTHFTAYVIVNSFITVTKIFTHLRNGESLTDAFWDMGTFFVWLAWGVGLAFHAANTFDYMIFGKNWEDRQMRKFMEKEDRVQESPNYTFRIGDGKD